MKNYVIKLRSLQLQSRQVGWILKGGLSITMGASQISKASGI